MNNPSQMKRDHTPSPDKGRVGEGLAAQEETNARYKLTRPKPPSIPPCQGGRNPRMPQAIAQPRNPEMACLEVYIAMASSTFNRTRS
jgi:hypothetical protein